MDKKNCNWFEGYRHFTPSTNNCLESCNKLIKDEYTFRERLLINRFKIVAINIFEKWSLDYKHKLKVFSSLPSISLQVWTAAYQWVKLKKNIIKRVGSDGIGYYLIPSGVSEELSADIIEKYENNNFNNFDACVKSQQSLWEVTEFNDDWKSSTCTCPFFFKNYMCKHSVGMPIRKGVLKPPPEAKNIPLGQKRKRGRPSKAMRALIIQ